MSKNNLANKVKIWNIKSFDSTICMLLLHRGARIHKFTIFNISYSCFIALHTKFVG